MARVRNVYFRDRESARRKRRAAGWAGAAFCCLLVLLVWSTQQEPEASQSPRTPQISQAETTTRHTPAPDTPAHDTPAPERHDAQNVELVPLTPLPTTDGAVPEIEQPAAPAVTAVASETSATTARTASPDSPDTEAIASDDTAAEADLTATVEFLETPPDTSHEVASNEVAPAAEDVAEKPGFFSRVAAFFTGNGGGQARELEGEVVADSEDALAIHEAEPSETLPADVLAEVAKIEEDPLRTEKGLIKSGQTAAGLLSEFLDSAQIHALAQACKKVFPLSKLRAGNPYTIVSENGAFRSFSYEIDGSERLVVSYDPEAEDFGAACEPIHYDVQTVQVAGRIDSSLFGAVSEAGEGPAFAVNLADIFGWEIDFIREIRTGDSFSAVVEKRYREGTFAGYGRILAARFVNQGLDYEGYRFEHEDGLAGYYDAKGRNLKKAFLKAPLSFTRISSGFTWKRFHPIKHVYRAHPAIDYAAPIGTPVKTVGDGTVIAATYQRAAGNYVKVRHANGYETTYMHLKGFARGIRKGRKVTQGQVIAYVGSTGLSTGPHLDFRMKKNGKFLNPNKIENPRAASLSPKLMTRLNALVAEMRPLLDKAGATELAMHE